MSLAAAALQPWVPTLVGCLEIGKAFGDIQNVFASP